MLTLKTLQSLIDAWAPPHTAEEWDNVGIQIGDPQQAISEIVVALEVDDNVLSYLEKKQSCCVITHHPLFFKPLKRLRYDQDLGRIVSIFVSGNHHLFSAHTNLDVAKDGVNDCLIDHYQLKLKGGQPILNGFGTFFDKPKIASINDLAAILPCQRQGSKSDEPILRLGFCAGSGHGFINRIIDLKIDTFITGEVTYHDHVTCQMNGIRLLCLGHKESEIFICQRIKDYLVKNNVSLPITVFD